MKTELSGSVPSDNLAKGKSALCYKFGGYSCICRSGDVMCESGEKHSICPQFISFHLTIS